MTEKNIKVFCEENFIELKGYVYMKLESKELIKTIKDYTEDDRYKQAVLIDGE